MGSGPLTWKIFCSQTHLKYFHDHNFFLLQYSNVHSIMMAKYSSVSIAHQENQSDAMHPFRNTKIEFPNPLM